MKSRKETARFRHLAAQLAEVGRGFYERGWALGTSGNFSAVANREPLRLAITASGVDKSRLTPRQILQVDGAGTLLADGAVDVRAAPPAAEARARNRPSDETKLHLAVVRARDAGAVLHTHSIWSTILSEVHAERGGLALEGYEMLKGLDGIRTHEHREWLPIIENSQDMYTLARTVAQALARHPNAHGFLLQGHGLYSWGSDLATAKRHVEILEFLLEVAGRKLGSRN
ncbi:MAG TPA: methylthioribulose 1-phosphate dehydratase [Terriglobia bacterium]|nr:methylthioribulose 1-phosphate dehydratase [Terriglobia bacterium]